MTACTVGVSFGNDKLVMLEDALRKTNFHELLDAKLSESRKSRDAFSVVIKPNLMMFTHKEDPPATYTDPELVEHMVKILSGAGFTNIKVVEAQNIYGNWYENRTVANVAKAAGFAPSEHGYHICDLTEEAVPHDYGGRLKNHLVGRSWKDADFRISFAKNKTHVSNLYTLTLKNVYGTLPAQNKALEYHALREWDESTLENLKNFPVHFGIIDAVYSADGLLGFKGTASPKNTKMILASASLVAVDVVAGSMMGVRPEASKLTKLAIREWGMPKITTIGIASEYRHPDWDNLSIKNAFTRSVFKLITRITGRRPDVPSMLNKSYFYHLLQQELPEITEKVADFMEESYFGFNIAGIISNGMVGDKMDTDLFPRRRDLYENMLKNMKGNIKDIVSNRGRRRALLKDSYENIFGA